ncbi:MAG: very short patch repair endonuclease, partial [Terriglobales bacterium]
HRGCPEAHRPKSRTEYWLPKLARNAQRDKENYKQLLALGWCVLVIWECEVTDIEDISAKLRKFLG